MKLLSLGNFDRKIFIILLIYLIIFIIEKLMTNYYFSKLNNYSINFSLSLIVLYGFNIFFSIPEYIIRKKGKRKEKEHYKNEDNKILYIFTKPKQMKYKGFPFLCLCLLLNIGYQYLFFTYILFHYIRLFFVMDIESDTSFEITFFLLFSKLIGKNRFYIHHYIPMVIIILMSIIRYIISLYIIKYEFVFPDDLLVHFNFLLVPLLDSILYFVKGRYMKYRYYSPFFISFLHGIIFSVISLIVFLIFLNKDCGESSTCMILSEKTIITEKLTIFLIIIDSLMYACINLIEALLINNFSVFHLILFFSFSQLFKFFFVLSGYKIYEIIIITVSFVIQIFAILVFNEMIILNFWGFNHNVKKNIIFRAENEIDKLDNYENDNNDSDIDSKSDSSIELRDNIINGNQNNIEDNNTIY